MMRSWSRWAYTSPTRTTKRARVNSSPARELAIFAVIVGAAGFVLAPTIFATEGHAQWAFVLALIDRALLVAAAVLWYRTRAA